MGFLDIQVKETRILLKHKKDFQTRRSRQRCSGQDTWASFLSSILGQWMMEDTLHLYYIQQRRTEISQQQGKQTVSLKDLGLFSWHGERLLEDHSSQFPSKPWLAASHTDKLVLVTTLGNLPQSVFQPLVPSSLSCSVRILFFRQLEKVSQTVGNVT